MWKRKTKWTIVRVQFKTAIGFNPDPLIWDLSTGRTHAIVREKRDRLIFESMNTVIVVGEDGHPVRHSRPSRVEVPMSNIARIDREKP